MPAYRKQVVTFLDIMGFREIVKSQDADSITDTLDLIQAKAAAPAVGAGEDTSIISFSDSVIRARPCAKDPIEALLYEVNELATAQWDLLESGILVRGGITIGDVLMVPGRAFGPAFVRAYELESSWARSPRIVFDPASVLEIRERAKAGAPSASRKLIVAVRSHLRLDQDGIWFVDYITSAFLRLGAENHRSALMRHRDIIISSANDLKASSPVWAKYLWLIRYFNASVQRLHGKQQGLKILRSDVPLADELLIPSPLKKPAG